MIRLAAINMAWQLGGNSALIAQACNGADVVLVCEALATGGKTPERLAGILPDGWQTNQDTTSTALAGSAVLWRTAVMAGHTHMSHDPIEASPGNRLVRARYLNPVLLAYKPTGDTRRYVPFHAPLRITGKQAGFYENLTRYLATHPLAVAGGDGNRPQRWVTGVTGRKAIGSEVMSVLLPHDLQGHAHRVRFQVTPYSDHPIIRVQLDPRKKARR